MLLLKIRLPVNVARLHGLHSLFERNLLFFLVLFSGLTHLPLCFLARLGQRALSIGGGLCLQFSQRAFMFLLNVLQTSRDSTLRGLLFCLNRGHFLRVLLFHFCPGCF